VNPLLASLPPHLRSRVEGVSVEVAVLLLLPPSSERLARLSELRTDAQRLALDCAPFVSLEFRELETPSSWRDCYRQRLSQL